MAERSAEVDQMKGATLEQISSMVEEIGREFKGKQAQLSPLMAELKVSRRSIITWQIICHPASCSDLFSVECHNNYMLSTAFLLSFFPIFWLLLSFFLSFFV